MRFFDWLLRRPSRPTPSGQTRYEYPTGNVELAMRVERGEFLMAVMAEIKPRWTPGNEYLWDDYDPESLLDTPEKRQHLVNALLFGRLTVYRALRAAGRDVRGRDPFEFEDQVPEVMVRLRKRFPGVFKEGARPVRFEARPLKLSPGDPGVAPPPPDDPALRQRLDQLERQALDAIHKQRTTEVLLTPRERIKKRLNLPRALPADYRADGSVPVLSAAGPADAVPSVVVVNNVGIGLKMPCVLFEYLYCQRPPTTDDQRVINDALASWGVGPESL